MINAKNRQAGQVQLSMVILFLIVLIGAIIYVMPSTRTKIERMFKETGTLEIVTSESIGEVSVKINGEDQGAISNWQKSFLVGSYDLSFSNERYHDGALNVSIQKNKLISVIVAKQGENIPQTAQTVVVYLSQTQEESQHEEQTATQAEEEDECRQIEMYLGPADKTSCKKYTNSCNIPNGYILCSPDEADQNSDTSSTDLR